MYLYFNFYVMNTLKKEKVLVEQPMPEEQEELQSLFEHLDVVIEKRFCDILNGKNGGG